MTLSVFACERETAVGQLPPDHAFIAAFEERVARTIREHRLLAPSDNVLVAVSGGKDSTVLLYALKKLGYNVSAVTVDVHIGCYTRQNLENVTRFCGQLGVRLYASSFRSAFGAGVCFIRDALRSRGANVSSCTVCGVLRRNLLNQLGREAGATALATGHNLDDEVQTVLMNLLRNRARLNARIGPIAGIGPDARLVPRVKPLFWCREQDIARYSKMHAFPVQYARCPCSADGLRAVVRQLCTALEAAEPGYRENLMTAFLRQQAKLKSKLAAGCANSKPQPCASCGEPCSAEQCRTCDLLVRAKQSFARPASELACRAKAIAAAAGRASESPIEPLDQSLAESLAGQI